MGGRLGSTAILLAVVGCGAAVKSSSTAGGAPRVVSNVAGPGQRIIVPGRHWAESDYCLHALQDGGTTTIVVEAGPSWIR